MRPTDLSFRSPKEKTPDSYNPNTTYDGRSLSFTPKSKKPRLPQARRFMQYDDLAKRTGYVIGPGHYKLNIYDISHSRAKNVPRYKPAHGHKDIYNSNYFFVGNHLVCDDIAGRPYEEDRELNTSLRKKLVKPTMIKRVSTQKQLRSKDKINYAAKSPYYSSFFSEETNTK